MCLENGPACLCAVVGEDGNLGLWRCQAHNQAASTCLLISHMCHLTCGCSLHVARQSRLGATCHFSAAGHAPQTENKLLSSRNVAAVWCACAARNGSCRGTRRPALPQQPPAGKQCRRYVTDACAARRGSSCRGTRRPAFPQPPIGKLHCCSVTDACCAMRGAGSSCRRTATGRQTMSSRCD